MKTSLPYSCIVLLVGLSTGGCEIVGLGSNGEVKGNVAVDLGGVAQAGKTVATTCKWVMSSVSVFANSEEVGSTSLDELDPVTSASVSVHVPSGMTDFSARVFTRSGLLALEGTSPTPVDVDANTSNVRINLEGVAPALQVCYDDDTVPFEITNRGGGDMEWQFSAESEIGCEGDCVTAKPSSGSLGPGESVILALLGFGPTGKYYCTETTGGGESFRVPYCRNDKADICAAAPVPDC
ncbi:MAG: hypothetical protein ACC655_04795 [Rhodothermia bacterium]